MALYVALKEALERYAAQREALDLIASKVAFLRATLQEEARFLRAHGIDVAVPGEP